MKQTKWYTRERVEPKWYVVDAAGKRLGRLATEVAKLLIGKHKPQYTPGQLVGDFVIVVNCDKVVVTGKKESDKIYYRHSGYPGGLKALSFREMMQRDPRKVVRLAVKGMLPKNRLRDRLIRRLKLYTGPHHPHQAQQPKPWEV